jgi:hypothetical protein
MKAQELRIGNLILKEGEIITVSSYTFYNIECDEEAFEPIPLTKELLLRLGFDVNNRPEWIDQLKKYEIICGTTSYLRGAENSVHPIKYVHQLQNLHFALTGEEITI